MLWPLSYRGSWQEEFMVVMPDKFHEAESDVQIYDLKD